MKRISMLSGAGILLLCSMVTALTSSIVEGAVPQLINFQGILKDGSGNPVANGSYSVTFTIYDAFTGGTAFWAETTSVMTTSGLFSILLGSFNPVPDSAFNNSNRWLGIKVGADPEMTPRQRVATVGYAYQAGWNTNASGDIYRTDGNVGIGTPSPAERLTVAGSMEVGTNSADYQHLRIGGGNSSGFLYGSYPHFGDGIHVGYNYYADATGTNQILRPDGGTSRISMSYGSVALATAPPFGGEPVDRLFVSSSGRVGIGTSVPVAALHVEIDGAATATGTAIWGENTATSGAYYGVYGRSDSPSGYGVFSYGKFAASGSKSFRIDHPKDPAHKYLIHYSAESPEVLNMYTGNVVTDGDGYAKITLPEYFEEINKDPRYTLTVINEGGTEFVQAMVVEEIKNNWFAIRTSKPNVKVSWRVDAIRNDLWVRAYGAPVEVEKQGFERGKYQHPELYGKPKEMGINYRPDMDHPTPETSIKGSIGEVRE